MPARRPRKIIVAGDNDTPSLLAEMTKTADVLVHEATYTADVALKIGKGPQHSTAKQVAEFAQVFGITNLILTHFSSRYQGQNDNKVDNQSFVKPWISHKLSINAIASEAKQSYQGKLFLANDLDVFHLSREGELTIVK